MKYWVIDVRTESGDEHGYLMVGKNKPTDEQVDAFLATKLPDEFHEEWGVGGVSRQIHEVTPFEFEV